MLFAAGPSRPRTLHPVLKQASRAPTRTRRKIALLGKFHLHPSLDSCTLGWHWQPAEIMESCTRELATLLSILVEPKMVPRIK